ncbi:hypothetical protein M427DRAFT_49194 [Gonapodya prolifera JEL478]|uniref:RNI-like protein n=1 Tax=Gonapodya prolifera (strain JEL478) TaxID=1344416 RepID=A0A138ZYW7_GONPJ|nr:hypothetical protein M427DRAFT_49194 [Gonapodya prolifera JEL478]|eukprot:KXS09699.1 hypothetical protein M427DRAFT_49194 [Gonapodya prolifera JEL478]
MFEFIRLWPNLEGTRLVHTGVIGTPDLFAPYLPPTLRRISITRWWPEHLSFPSTIEELQRHQCVVIDILSQRQRMPALRPRDGPLLAPCGAGLERLVLKGDYGERWIGSIEDAVMADVAELCPNLTPLSLASVLISDVGVASLAAGCPRLDRLELKAGSGEGRPSVSDVSLVTIFTTWPRLRGAETTHHLEMLDMHLLGGLKLHDFAALKTLPRLKKVTFKSFFLPGDYSDEARNRMAREMPFELVLEV